MLNNTKISWKEYGYDDKGRIFEKTNLKLNVYFEYQVNREIADLNTSRRSYEALKYTSIDAIIIITKEIKYDALCNVIISKNNDDFKIVKHIPNSLLPSINTYYLSLTKDENKID